MLEKIFKLSENKSNVRTEIIAGATTFMTMAYIIFVNPAILQMAIPEADIDFRKQFFLSIMAATCISSAFPTILMGLYANYPIALYYAGLIFLFNLL